MATIMIHYHPLSCCHHSVPSVLWYLPLFSDISGRYSQLPSLLPSMLRLNITMAAVTNTIRAIMIENYDSNHHYCYQCHFRFIRIQCFLQDLIVIDPLLQDGMVIDSVLQDVMVIDPLFKLSTTRVFGVVCIHYKSVSLFQAPITDNIPNVTYKLNQTMTKVILNK